ncbi:hypothetical protein CC80DRAFT_531924 [Byssothecium circinans]|uniref:U4/U6.U5 small nuclear ribonucleoprotein 27kDa protein domain-containing protein n=1 Tax=Byssothecium circinans TaxID=147558 RepID=A0A6A5UBQ4_9PLEO|nr:hypothetical protein CC80DRAFT_531924 [Byssothecium circinans]
MANNGRGRYEDRDLDVNDPRDAGRDRGKPSDDRRNRSRSPRRDRGGGGQRNRYRSRSPMRRDRDDRGGHRGSHRDRDRDSRHPRDAPRGPHGAPSGPRKDFRSSRSTAPPVTEPKDEPMEEDKPKRERPEGMDDETWDMYKVMGFGRFKSTKNTKVPGNELNFGVRKDKKMEARQYMNRQGGFNRPLSPGRG